MTTDATAVADTEMMDYLARVAEVSVDPPGSRQPLPSEEVQGAIINYSKVRAPITFNGMNLPERVLVFDRQGNTSLVAPMQATKRVNGRRVFFSPAEYGRLVESGELQPKPDVQYIDQTCDICNERRFAEGNLVPRRFISLNQYRNHMRGFHSQEWEDMQTDANAAGSLEQMRLMRELVAAQTGVAPVAAPVAPAEVQAVSSEPQQRIYACDYDGCKRFFDKPQALHMHKVSAHREKPEKPAPRVPEFNDGLDN